MTKTYCDRCKKEIIHDPSHWTMDWYAWIYRGSEGHPRSTGKLEFCEDCWDDVYDFMKGCDLET